MAAPKAMATSAGALLVVRKGAASQVGMAMRAARVVTEVAETLEVVAAAVEAAVAVVVVAAAVVALVAVQMVEEVWAQNDHTRQASARWTCM